MMDAAREWLLGVTAAAILAALAEGLMQEGGPKRVGRLVCGLVLLAAVFRPAAELTLPAEGGLSGYSAQIEEQADRLRTDTNDWMKLVIEEQCAAYVMDKAAELGDHLSGPGDLHPGRGGGVPPLEVQRDGGPGPGRTGTACPGDPE